MWNFCMADGLLAIINLFFLITFFLRNNNFFLSFNWFSLDTLGGTHFSFMWTQTFSLYFIMILITVFLFEISITLLYAFWAFSSKHCKSRNCWLFQIFIIPKKKRKVLFNGDLENKNIWTSIKNVTKQ